MDENIVWLNPGYKEQAYGLAKGDYQRGLLDGTYRWSGSDIKGKYKGSYQSSRNKLLTRLQSAGIPAQKVKKDSNRVVLVIG
jgi:hypothetical protein